MTMMGAGKLRTCLGVFAWLLAVSCESAFAQNNPDVTSSANSPTELKTLLDDLESDSLETRNHATRQLGKSDVSIIPVLANVLMSGSPEQRTRVKRALFEMGSRNDARTLAKIRRVLFLVSQNGHPYLMKNDAKLQSAWRRVQSTNTIDELKRRRITVHAVPVLNSVPAFEILLDPSISGFNVVQPVVESTAKIPVNQGRSTQQICDEISRIASDDEAADCEAIRLIDSHYPSPAPDICYQVYFDETWNNETDDLSLLQDLSGISSLSLIRTPITGEMFEALLRVNTSMVSIHNCKFDASELKAFVRSREATTVDIRPNAVLGVRGLTTNLAPTTGHSLDTCTISALIDGCPARDAGIKVGDTIVQIGENPIESFQDLIFDVAARDIGELVKITLERNGETIVIEVNLGDAKGIKLR